MPKENQRSLMIRHGSNDSIHSICAFTSKALGQERSGIIDIAQRRPQKFSARDDFTWSSTIPLDEITNFILKLSRKVTKRRLAIGRRNENVFGTAQNNTNRFALPLHVEPPNDEMMK